MRLFFGVESVERSVKSFFVSHLLILQNLRHIAADGLFKRLGRTLIPSPSPFGRRGFCELRVHASRISVTLLAVVASRSRAAPLRVWEAATIISGRNAF